MPRSAMTSTRRSMLPAPMRWTGARRRSGRSRCCRKASSRLPNPSRRRPNSRAGSSRSASSRGRMVARLAALLKPGQRLVSREGDLWRWDGFAAGAHAPTGAARRLAERGRLADIDGEINAARAEVEAKRRVGRDRAIRARCRGRGRRRRARGLARRRSARPRRPAKTTPPPNGKSRATPPASPRSRKP